MPAERLSFYGRLAAHLSGGRRTLQPLRLRTTIRRFEFPPHNMLLKTDGEYGECAVFIGSGTVVLLRSSLCRWRTRPFLLLPADGGGSVAALRSWSKPAQEFTANAVRSGLADQFVYFRKHSAGHGPTMW